MFEDGNTIRMFEPNFRYPYNDGATWIPAAILAYLNESGDLGILDEKIPYIKGNTKENTSYVEGVVTYEDYSKICTEETYSVFDHCNERWIICTVAEENED
jgi:cellobiose phosphorylase